MMQLFGSNGVRGVINEDITAGTALALGKAIGRSYQGDVALAIDARGSGQAMRAAVAAGIMAVGSNVVDLGVAPLPALQFYVTRHSEIAGGVMITASHSPMRYNGLKFISSEGAEAPASDEQTVRSFFEKGVSDVERPKMGELRVETGAAEYYVDSIVASVDAEKIRSANLTVCVDCGNGATSLTTPSLLRKLGVKTVSLECDISSVPRRESEPDSSNLRDLQAVVPAVGADLGVAHDEDGGRAVFIDSTGAFIQGDRSGAIIASRMLSGDEGKIVTSVSSSDLLKEVVEKNGGVLVYSEVGFQSVIGKIVENAAILGVEEDGGMVFPSFNMCRDGGMALAKMLEAVAANGPLKDQADEFPAYYTVKTKVACPDQLKQCAMDRFRENLQAEEAKVDAMDGLKIRYESGWVLVRPSTTEDCIRIHSDSKIKNTATAMAEDAVNKLSKIIENLDRGSWRAQPIPR